jgi:insecticidal toxin complex protein TccC
LQYNRNAPADTAQQLISQQCYGVRGELLSSIDPRLFAEQQVNPSVLPNFRYRASLSGQVLRSQSQDAGDNVVVYDVESGPAWQEDSRGQIKRVAYDVLHRPNTVFEQDGPGASERISERNVYGESETNAAQVNARGRLIRNYDTAGLNAVPSYSCTGQPLLLVRQLLSDPLVLTDWQGSEANWQTALASEPFRTQLGYNALGDGVKNVDARGNQQYQQFNIAGQLASSTLLLAGQTVERPMLTTILYSAAGQVLQEVAGNGVRSDYSYEAQTQRLSQLLTSRPVSGSRDTLLQDLNYSYDPVGNILSIGNAAIPVSYHRNQRIEPANDYQYDALYQLISATGRENASAGQQGQGLPVPEIPISADPNQYSHYTRLYTYDRGGNLTQIRHQGRGNYTLATVVSPGSNRAVQQSGHILPSDVDAFFDACGNLTQLAPGQPLYWDGRNQLQRVVQVTRPPGRGDDVEYYQYDGGDQRLRKTTLSQTSGTQRTAEVIYLPGLELRRTLSTRGSSTTIVEDLQVIRAGSAGRQQVRVLHWDIGRPVDIPNDQLRGSLDNQIGSSVLELDQEANLLTMEEYFPYGGTAVWSGRTFGETQYKFVRYSGKELDATGLYYYGYRYYVPWLGRWLNPDPAGTVDGLNLFGFVRNNPINYLDPDGKNRISDEFVWSGHMKALEDASRKGNFAVSFRSAGRATLDALAKGAAAKGHNILEKTIKKSSIENTYGAEKAPRVLAEVKSAGIEGYVGHWSKTELVGIYLSGESEHDKPIYPIDIENLEESLVSLKSQADWSAIPFTGDYDMHDLITFRGAGRPRTVLTDSKEEQDIIDMMNNSVASVDSNRPFDVKQRNTIRHGPQVNFLSHMVASESDVVASAGGVLGAVARPGEFPVAMLDRGRWTVLANIEQLDAYYSSVGARIKESWKPGGVRYFKNEKFVNLERRHHRN